MKWLHSCEYVSDTRAAGTTEHWMTPREFELVQRGDCEDHALWAWRKCVDLLIPARFAWGLYRDSPHAWVQVHGRIRTVLETTAKGRDRSGIITHPSHVARYATAVSVDRHGRFYKHDLRRRRRP
jgi:hypothetical protein